MIRPTFGLSVLVFIAACGHPAPRVIAVPPPPVMHPTDLEIRAAADLISEANTRQRLSVIADDSMGGRNTPSQGLEKVALYLADNFRAWGLTPAGDNGTYFQRYSLALTRLNVAQSYLELREGGRVARYTFDKLGTVTNNFETTEPLSGPVKIVAGALTDSIVSSLDLRGKIVIYVQDSARSNGSARILAALRDRAPLAVIQLRNYGLNVLTAAVASAVSPSSSTPRSLVGVPPAPIVPTLMIHDSLLADAGALNRPDWNQLRQSNKPIIADAPPEFVMSIMARRDTVDLVTAPNVVAMAEGSDSTLKHEFVLISAHMDHVGSVNDGVGGCRAFTLPSGAVDNICNGADDNGSGTVALLSMAQSAALIKSRPKRSILFVAVSGEEKGLFGSQYFAEHPTVAIDRIVANMNIDMIAENSPDSLWILGRMHSDLGPRLATMQAQHPELRMIASDETWPTDSFYRRTDHYSFAKKGIPVLSFYGGTHPEYHRPDDEIGLVNFSKLTRAAKLIFFMSIDVADHPDRPRWDPAAYQTIVVERKAPIPTRRP